MSKQPEQTSLSLSPSPAPTPEFPSSEAHSTPEREQRPAPQRIPPWLESAELFLRLLVRVFIGLLFLFAPWSGQLLWLLPRSRFLWDQNPLIMYFPVVAHYAASGAVRGLVSGLGLLNLWIAFQDALRHRDG